MPRSGGVIAVVDWQRFGRLYAEVRKVRLLTRITPKGHATGEVFTFETIHNKAGRIGSIEKEASGAPMNFDLYVRPRLGLQVSPGFINPRPLPPQRVPVESRLGNVLHGMIPHRLIVGYGVARSYIEHVVTRAVSSST